MIEGRSLGVAVCLMCLKNSSKVHGTEAKSARQRIVRQEVRGMADSRNVVKLISQSLEGFCKSF